MDFKSLMSAQLGKMKQAPASTSANSKYMKRAEVEAAREAAYLKEQAAKEAERIRKAENKRRFEEEEMERNNEREVKRRRLAEESKRIAQEEEEKEERERRKRIGLPEITTPSRDEDNSTPIPEEEDIAEEELLFRLRELKEPAILFGETHKMRLRRYQKLTGTFTETDSVLTTKLKPRNPNDPIPTTLEPVPEADMKVPAKIPPPSDPEARLFLARQLISWFTLVLKAWASALAGRTEETKKTFQGQQATNSMMQAVVHLTPLFRKLEKLSSTPSELQDDLLEPMVEIVRAAQERRYVDANDGYLKLSIGKAAWPIGVTMVGIHERSAREKLHDGQGKAHIMSDETTRKILQSIKRCLTFAQTRWEPIDQAQQMG